MDVLFGSIDIRELLSSQDFEDSSPLPAPDLRLLIDRLQVRSLHIKENVRDYILSHHKDFSEIFSSFSDVVSKTSDILSDVSNVLSLISDQPIDIEIRDALTEISMKRRKLKEKKELLILLQTIVNLVERLRLVREALKIGRLIDAAEAIKDLRKALMICEGQIVRVREPMVYDLLRKEWMVCCDEAQEMFVRVMDNAVQFNLGNGLVRVKFRLNVGGIEEVELQTVLTTMEVVGVLDYGFAKVADLMVKYVMIPTINNGPHFDFVEEINGD